MTVAINDLVLVRWLDSCGRGAWEPESEIIRWVKQARAEHISVGRLLTQDDDGICLAQSWVSYEDGVKNVNSVMWIPNVAVLGIDRLLTTPSAPLRAALDALVQAVQRVWWEKAQTAGVHEDDMVLIRDALRAVEEARQ